ncbi:hypothetical protein JXB22_04005 [candidate division WOR-3 bacterium]|nr:hypothetical protein [candidate division WOR-3 bacterium]
MTTLLQVYGSARPYVRWWWFAGCIDKDTIRFQLDWTKKNHFGGVELAWVYPLTQVSQGSKWLSPELSELVAYAKKYATRVGLGCDLTCGTAWPFGGSIVEQKDAAQLHDGLSSQRLEKSWEEPKQGYILNHLDHSALGRYVRTIVDAFSNAIAQGSVALFCDSWEVEGRTLWTRGFAEAFSARYCYDIMEFVDDLDMHPDVRFDYRALLSDYVLDEFYRPFTSLCHEAGAFSRVQCHGAPTDLLAAYALVDVPESEALLFDPPFSRIAASAAALTSKPLVSAESFTCLYGWNPYPGPGPFQKKEQIADMKLLADGLFANGVNMIVWHGMPYNPPHGSNQFYASVHVGPDSSFASDIPGFNEYLEKVSALMRAGQTYTDIAVYLPREDNWMRGEVPEDKKRPSARYCWEMQHERMPEETRPFHPLWINRHALYSARCEGGMVLGQAVRFRCLYVNTEWLDQDTLEAILRLARQGLPVCMKQRSKQPGRHQDEHYQKTMTDLFSCETVRMELAEVIAHQPFLMAGQPLEYWCRKHDDEVILFIAHPLTTAVSYPMEYGQSLCAEAKEIPITLNVNGHRIDTTLVFKPYQSLCVRLSAGGTVTYEDIVYEPPVPVHPVNGIQ